MPRNRERDIKEGIRERWRERKTENKSFSHTLLAF